MVQAPWRLHVWPVCCCVLTRNVAAGSSAFEAAVGICRYPQHQHVAASCSVCTCRALEQFVSAVWAEALLLQLLTLERAWH